MLFEAGVKQGGFDTVADARFPEDVADMRLDGLGAQEKFLGNFVVGHAFADVGQNFHFPP